MTLARHRPVTMTKVALYCICGQRFRFSEDEMRGKSDAQLQNDLLDLFNIHRRQERRGA